MATASPFKNEEALIKSKHPKHPMLALQEMCLKQRLPQPNYEISWNADKVCVRSITFKVYYFTAPLIFFHPKGGEL